jgi:hypothetical protein
MMVPSHNAALEQKVNYLLDLEALRDLLLRYCRGVDRGDEELLMSVYHEDAYEDHAGLFQGRAVAFVRRVMEMYRDKPAPMQHILTNARFEIEGDVAYGESYVAVRHAQVPEDRHAEGFARYLDRFERRGGEWRIAHRQLIFEWDGVGGDGYDFGGARRDRTDPSYGVGNARQPV